MGKPRARRLSPDRGGVLVVLAAVGHLRFILSVARKREARRGSNPRRNTRKDQTFFMIGAFVVLYLLIIKWAGFFVSDLPVCCHLQQTDGSQGMGKAGCPFHRNKPVLLFAVWDVAEIVLSQGAFILRKGCSRDGLRAFYHPFSSRFSLLISFPASSVQSWARWSGCCRASDLRLPWPL